MDDPPGATLVDMPLFRAQAIFPMFTNLPRDVIQNNFHFVSDEPTEAVVAAVAGRLSAFYQTATVAASNRANYVNWEQAYVKVFNMSDPPPRVPAELGLAIPAGTGATNIPTEVAMVMTFQAAPQSGVAYQRLYNRIYLGGLANGWLSVSAADAFPRFAPTFITAVCTAAENLLTANTVDPAVREIVGGWVDNGPDTQRRRSVDSSARTNWV